MFRKRKLTKTEFRDANDPESGFRSETKTRIFGKFSNPEPVPEPESEFFLKPLINLAYILMFFTKPNPNLDKKPNRPPICSGFASLKIQKIWFNYTFQN
jgi:hypothetical protein